MCQGMHFPEPKKIQKAAVGAAAEAPKLLTVAIVTGIGMAIGTVIGQIVVAWLGLDVVKASVGRK